MHNIIAIIILILSLMFAQDNSEGSGKISKEITIGYTTGTLEIETESGDVEGDYETLVGRYGSYSSETTQWGGFYELDLEDSELDLLGAYVRSYLQKDIFSPFLELDLGIAMGEDDNQFLIGGMIGGKYELNQKHSFDLGFRFLYCEGDDIWYYFSSVLLGCSVRL